MLMQYKRTKYSTGTDEKSSLLTGHPCIFIYLHASFDPYLRLNLTLHLLSTGLMVCINLKWDVVPLIENWQQFVWLVIYIR